MAEGWAEAMEAMLAASPTPPSGDSGGASPQPPSAPHAADAVGGWMASLEARLAEGSEAEDAPGVGEEVLAPATPPCSAAPGAAEGQAMALDLAEGEAAPVGLGVAEAAPADPFGHREVLRAAQRAMTVDDTALERDTFDAATHMCSLDTGIRSVTALAKTVGVSRQRAATVRAEAASASVEYEREAWSYFEQRVDALPPDKIQKLLYLEVAAYDGVDLYLGSKRGERPSAEAGGGALEGDVKGAHGEPVGAGSAAPDLEGRPAPALTKLLHSETSTLLVLGFDGGTVGALTRHLNPLQALDRHTSDNMVWALGEQSRVTSFSGGFARKVRLVMTDAGQNNIKCERHVMAARGPGWHGLHLCCHVHTLSNIHAKVFDLASAQITGLVAYARSLAGGGHLSTMRRALLSVLSERLSIEAVHPLPLEAVRYRELVLGMLLGKDAADAPRRRALARLASGDWRDSSKVVYMTNSGEARAQVMELMAKHLVPCLLGHLPYVWPRHRWTGFSKSLSDAGLLLCVHGLLLPTYQRFLQLQFGVTRGLAAPEASADVAAAAEVQEREAAAGAPSGQRSLAGPSWAEANRQHRGEALDWMTQGPAPQLLLMKAVLDPLEWLMQQELSMASGEWGSRQWGQACLEGNQQLSWQDFARCRSWPLIAAASGDVSRTVMAKLREAQDPARFALFHHSAFTLEFRHQAFKMFSREGCSLYEQVLKAQAAYPYRLFRLLVSPGMREPIMDDCDNLRDSYSQAFLAHHGGNLHSQEAMSELLAIAMLARTSTSRLESLHAHIARLLKGNWRQVAQPCVDAVSAEYVLGRLRRREREFVEPIGVVGYYQKKRRGRKAKRAHPMRTKSGKAKKTGGGGAWRAFLSERLRGQARPRITAQLAAEYHSLHEAERQRLKGSGKAATRHHRTGAAHSFGLRLGSRAHKRTMQQAFERERGEQLEQLSLSQAAGALSDVPRWGPAADFGQEVKALRTDARCLRRYRRDCRVREAQRFQGWRATEGGALASASVARVPALATLAPALRAVPWARPMTMLEYVPPCGEVIPRALAHCRRSPAGAALCRRLAKDWVDRHRLFEHNQAPQPAPADAPKRGNQKPSCREAGLCICGERGELTWKTKGHIMKGLKSLLGGPELRNKLSTGDVVLHLREDPEGPDGNGADLESTVPQGAEHWLHVGLMYWSPQRPTFRKLAKMRGAEEAHVELLGEHSYQTVFELAEALAERGPNVAWTMAPFELLDTPRPIPALDPTMVLAKKLPGEYSWTSGRRMARRGGDAAADSWEKAVEALLEAHEGAESDGDIDDDESVPEGGYVMGEGEGARSAEGSEDEDELADMFYSESEFCDDFGADLPAGEGDVEGEAQDAESPAASTTSSSSSSSPTSPSPGAAGGDARGAAEVAAEPSLAFVAEPPVPAPRAAGIRGPRAPAAELDVALPAGGKIKYYPSTQQIVAHCRIAEHGDCRLTRTVRGGRRAGQGRPLGLLLSWVQMADLFETQDAHVRLRGDAGDVVKDIGARRSAREQGLAQPDLGPVFAKERPQREGEPMEPEDIN